MTSAYQFVENIFTEPAPKYHVLTLVMFWFNAFWLVVFGGLVMGRYILDNMAGYHPYLNLLINGFYHSSNLILVLGIWIVILLAAALARFCYTKVTGVPA